MQMESVTTIACSELCLQEDKQNAIIYNETYLRETIPSAKRTKNKTEIQQ